MENISRKIYQKKKINNRSYHGYIGHELCIFYSTNGQKLFNYAEDTALEKRWP